MNQSQDEHRRAHFDALPVEIREFLRMRARVNWESDGWLQFTRVEKDAIMQEVRRFDSLGRQLREFACL